MKNLIFFMALCGFVVFPSAAQEEIPQASKAPYAAMQRLAPLIGRWQIVTEFSPDNGASWQTSEPALVDVSMRQKELMLVETPLDTQLPGFHVETIIGYDQYREVYRLVAVDDTWGLVDLYEGNLEGNKVVVTNLKSGTFFPVGENRWRGFRITVELGSLERTMTVEKTDDNGVSWQPNFKIHYIKQ